MVKDHSEHSIKKAALQEVLTAGRSEKEKKEAPCYQVENLSPKTVLRQRR